ncbi:MAG: hypothetical protein L3K07_00565 [Thermoplasmata archaeon]|nr:hypothetical protein [Thermoplasmata archaeon]
MPEPPRPVHDHAHLVRRLLESNWEELAFSQLPSQLERPNSREPGAQVPLFVNFPDEPMQGTIGRRTASLVDVVPTALAEVGLEAEPDLVGVSLRRLVNEPRRGQPRFIRQRRPRAVGMIHPSSRPSPSPRSPVLLSTEGKVPRREFVLPPTNGRRLRPVMSW